MADGSYERRGPREAELAKFRRIIAEAAARRNGAAKQSANNGVAQTDDK